VLDVGCGRGEWLDLLKENGLTAQGVDLNRVTVAQCRERGLSVVEGEAIEYLRALDADSLGAVTAMHVIEHIPFRRLIVLFDEVLRVLQPGGVAIFETPNPENLMVGACNFYNDPTHERPLPPEPTKVVAELRGFIDVSILRLHPMPENVQLVDGAPAVRDLINRLVYGAQDYALIARKPNQ
jgi:2-polyprenyl-3-methyl-5-hydroxy-6-metoxy-1,4-benzoquinol methylase